MLLSYLLTLIFTVAFSILLINTIVFFFSSTFAFNPLLSNSSINLLTNPCSFSSEPAINTVSSANLILFTFCQPTKILSNSTDSFISTWLYNENKSVDNTLPSLTPLFISTQSVFSSPTLTAAL